MIRQDGVPEQVAMERRRSIWNGHLQEEGITLIQKEWQPFFHHSRHKVGKTGLVYAALGHGLLSWVVRGDKLRAVNKIKIKREIFAGVFSYPLQYSAEFISAMR